MNETVYFLILVLFIPVFFTIFRALEIEKYFKKGKILEIRMAYILFSLIFAKLSADVISTIFYLF